MLFSVVRWRLVKAYKKKGYHDEALAIFRAQNYEELADLLETDCLKDLTDGLGSEYTIVRNSENTT